MHVGLESIACLNLGGADPIANCYISTDVGPSIHGGQ